MRFTQGIRVKCADADELARHLKDWDDNQASAEVMGFIGTRLFADRDRPGEFLIMADFAEVDGELTAEEEAERNSQRVETNVWAAKLRTMVEGEPEYIHYHEHYRTGITGNLRTG